MRDYGVVRVRFWSWAKRKKLSIEARNLALYLLTSPHGNSLGCFRLPMAYLCDDMDTTPKAVEKPMRELQEVGFIRREEVEGWTWICDYLEHNPIPNYKAGMAVLKLLREVPACVPFVGELLENIPVRNLDTDGIDTLKQALRYGIDTVSCDSGTQDQDQEQDLTNNTFVNSDESERELTEAFDEFVAAAKRHDWPKPRALDPDRRKKLRARLAEHGVDGWRQMLREAEASNWLTTEFKLRLDWVLEPRNFRKIVEGNYRNSAREEPPRKVADWN